MWLKNPDATLRTWANAITYCEAMDGAAGRGGYTDWRMPNVRELMSLVNYGAYNPALPPGHSFTGIQMNYYWVSTTVTQYPTYAWAVHLGNGTVYAALKSSPPLYTLPVRGGR